MKTDWRVEAPQLAILVAMFALAVFTWPTAPDQIPVHWNIRGQVDRYGGRFEGLLFIPLIATALYALLRFAPKIDPGRANYASFASAFGVLRIAILATLAVVYGMMHLVLRGRDVNVNVVVSLAVGALFVVIGTMMGKIRPNWLVGLRTPWTLSSKTAWVRTHRLGGWLFIAHGLAIMLAIPLLSDRVAMPIVVGGAVAIGAWSLVYSYVVWRHDPNKVPPAGTLPADPQ